MTSIKLYPGDNRVTLQRMIDEGIRVHSVVTDPPYGLVSVQKRFGKGDCAPARKEGNDGSFSRLSGGFMGKQWDGTGIERDPEFWKLIHDILLPGGFVFAFSGSRTGHWQACAMETAGLIMHPMHGWVFGTGFPKAHAADKAIDKHLGVKRPVVGTADVGPDMTGDNYGRNDGSRRIAEITTAGSDEAKQWEGWAYGTQAQKPALEPIYLAQKPFSEKNGALNLMMHGVGAVNIDDCRVGERYPSNLIHDGSDEIVAMFPARAGANSPVKGTEPPEPTDAIYGKFAGRVPSNHHGDEGSAARFFHGFQPDLNPIIYSGKAGKNDRAGSKHPTVKPVELIRYLVRHLTPKGGVVLDPFAGTGTTAEAAQLEGFDCILMEAEDEYVDFLNQRFDGRLENATVRRRRGIPELPAPKRRGIPE